MMISHSRRFVFVKTKKTAGTSIECALAPYLRRGDLTSPLEEHEPKYRRFSKEMVRILREKDGNIRARNPHLPASVVHEHFANDTAGYFSFCVERNPWDKAVSAFYFWISRHPVSRQNTEEENFKNFVQSDRLSFFSDFDLYMQDGEPLVDRILSYENLADEFSEVMTQVGLPNVSIRKMNAKTEQRPKAARSLKRYFGDDFGNPAAERVRSVFAREIEYFGYTPPMPG